MGKFVTVADVRVFDTEATDEQLDRLIRDGEGQAIMSAPCLLSVDVGSMPEHLLDVVQSTIRNAVLRWADNGVQQPTAITEARGPFQLREEYESGGKRTGLFWPSEIESLVRVCSALSDDAAASSDRAGYVDMIGGPVVPAGHAEVCSLYFGAAYCDCGAYLTRGTWPLWLDGA